MKNIMKKIIAVFAVLCVMATSFASCSGETEGSSSSSAGSSQGGGDSAQATTIDKEALKYYPLDIGSAKDGNALAGDGDIDLDGDDPVAVTTAKSSSGSDAVVTVVQAVTDANNQPVTQVVEVTDDKGEVQTDANNQTVTEVVNVTEVVTVPAEEAPDNPSSETTANNANSDYKAKNDGRYAMWIDCSKNENFLFEGDMLKAKFKVKEGIPDGDYKIRISPDLADVTGHSVYPSKIIDGTIRVNNGDIEAVDVSGENNSLVFYGDNVACKQGDTIEFNINVKNNTGLVAFCIWFYFDGNALEFVEAGASGAFEEIARQTQIGAGSKTE